MNFMKKTVWYGFRLSKESWMKGFMNNGFHSSKKSLEGDIKDLLKAKIISPNDKPIVFKVIVEDEK